MALMFLNGDGMRGGRAHYTIEGVPLVGERRTAPLYRFFSVRDEFPGLLLSPENGASIEGELYDVPMDNIRTDFLPDEPAELELTVIQLEDGRSVLAVGLRPGVVDAIPDQLTDITAEGGWRKYRGLPEPAEES